jgi:hypothetical protein
VEHRAGAGERVAVALRVRERADRLRAPGRRDARTHHIHRYRERDRIAHGVLDHERDPERVEPLRGQGDADQPGGVAQEERDRVRIHPVGRHHELALVLVGHHHGPPGGERGKSGLDRRRLARRVALLRSLAPRRVAGLRSHQASW